MSLSINLHRLTKKQKKYHVTHHYHSLQVFLCKKQTDCAEAIPSLYCFMSSLGIMRHTMRRSSFRYISHPINSISLVAARLVSLWHRYPTSPITSVALAQILFFVVVFIEFIKNIKLMRKKNQANSLANQFSFRYFNIRVVTFHIINFFIFIFSLNFHVPFHISPFLLQECLRSSGWRRTPRTAVMLRPSAFRANPCIHMERTIFAGHRHHRFWGTCVWKIIIVSRK